MAEGSTFETIETLGVTAPRCNDCSAVVYGDNLFVFGGDTGDDFSCELHKYNFETRVWSKVGILGCAPAPRSGHTAVVYGDEMFVYGGGVQLSVYADLYAYSFEHHTWRLIQYDDQKGPSPRRKHTSVLYGSRMYIFGGEDGKTFFNDTWFFDFNANVWAKALPLRGGIPTQINSNNASSAIQAIPHTTLPSQRIMHTAVLHRHSMVIFGGFFEQALGDIWEMDLRTHIWKECNCIKALPSPRHRHSSVMHLGNMYIFGGYSQGRRVNDIWFYSFSLHSWKEEKTKIRNVVRSSVVNGGQQIQQQQQQQATSLTVTANNNQAASSVQNQSSNQNQITTIPPFLSQIPVLQTTAFPLFYQNAPLFNVTGQQTTVVNVIPGSVTPRIQHTALMYRGDMYIFGGYDGAVYLNELVKFTISPPSTLMEDIQRELLFGASTIPQSSSLPFNLPVPLVNQLQNPINDSCIYADTRVFRTCRALISARLPSLLPFLVPVKIAELINQFENEDDNVRIERENMMEEEEEEEEDDDDEDDDQDNKRKNGNNNKDQTIQNLQKQRKEIENVGKAGKSVQEEAQKKKKQTEKDDKQQQNTTNNTDSNQNTQQVDPNSNSTSISSQSQLDGYNHIMHHKLHSHPLIHTLPLSDAATEALLTYIITDTIPLAVPFFGGAGVLGSGNQQNNSSQNQNQGENKSNQANVSQSGSIQATSTPLNQSRRIQMQPEPDNSNQIQNSLLIQQQQYIQQIHQLQQLQPKQLNVHDFADLIAFAEELGSLRIKQLCTRAIMATVDLRQLSNLGPVMIVAHRYGLVQLERKALYFFITLLPFSMALLQYFPQDVLLHFSMVLGKLLTAEEAKEYDDFTYRFSYSIQPPSLNSISVGNGSQSPLNTAQPQANSSQASSSQSQQAQSQFLSNTLNSATSQQQSQQQAFTGGIQSNQHFVSPVPMPFATGVGVLARKDPRFRGLIDETRKLGKF
ncbi:MAG: putative kelch motif family protein [Streblomastix strix]|uniref:Putative kelch motif family protein n=1 Tax=Streblomastix strix TaxID=222440 RepID=A0A5J4W9C6_9EUKA|nr:MAG: putative kelch motif family protein [Streblomastix strix]